MDELKLVEMLNWKKTRVEELEQTEAAIENMHNPNPVINISFGNERYGMIQIQDEELKGFILHKIRQEKDKKLDEIRTYLKDYE